MSIAFDSTAYGDYALGCDDPEYHQYIEERFAYFETKNRRLLVTTLRDYEHSVAASENPYQIIGDLSKHLKYSAQFEPISTVNAKIERMFEHAEALSAEQRIAGYALDRYSSESHSVNIARAWVAYRQGEHNVAFSELLMSLEINSSAVLSAYGPDFELVRQMYRDGYVAPVIAYINKTTEFWIGKRPNKLRNVWLKMIKAGCQIQFDSVDTIKATELGLPLIDVNKRLGLEH